ncbi:hypothetical protein D3C87_1116600 [compost metagenome]
MPLPGTARNCSLTALMLAPGPSVPGASRTGNSDVNQPTLREASRPASPRSSRPWPSNSISTLSRPVQSQSVRDTAVSRRSLIWVRYACGTSEISCSVNCSSSVTVKVSVSDTVLLPAALPGRSGSASPTTALQYGSSATRTSPAACRASACCQPRAPMLAPASCTSRPSSR